MSGRPLLALLSALLLALGAAACGGDDEGSGDKAKSGATTSAQSTAAETTGAGGCKTVSAPEPKPEGKLDAPKDKLDAKKTYTATFATNCGTFTIDLDVKNAPKTAGSFASLIREGFYDGLTFHRIVPEFVIQGGDPTGEGNGGPGYSVVEPPPSDVKYTRGVVAMAKTELEEPGTSGSQFYVVTGADAQLPPDYAVVGKVGQGQDVVNRIGVVPTDPASEKPIDPVVIEKATITEK